MKKTYTTLFLALLLLAACSEDPNTPEAVTRKFVTLLGNADYEGARELGTKNTERFIAFRAETMELLGEEPVQTVDVQKISCILAGAKADCIFCCDQNGDEMQVPLVQKGGVWQVDINIGGLLNDFQEKLKELEVEQEK